MNIAQTPPAQGVDRAYGDALPLLLQDFHSIPDGVRQHQPALLASTMLRSPSTLPLHWPLMGGLSH